MKLLPILLLITISGLTQPKTYLTDAFLRNDSLFATSNGVTVFKGKVTKQVISYLPEKGKRRRKYYFKMKEADLDWRCIVLD